MLNIPHFLDNRFTDGGKVVSQTHRPHFTPLKYYFPVSGPHSDVHNILVLVDFCVTKGIPPDFAVAHSCLDLSSDHSPELVTLTS
jgi:hypothetical protein